MNTYTGTGIGGKRDYLSNFPPNIPHKTIKIVFLILIVVLLTTATYIKTAGRKAVSVENCKLGNNINKEGFLAEVEFNSLTSDKVYVTCKSRKTTPINLTENTKFGESGNNLPLTSLTKKQFQAKLNRGNTLQVNIDDSNQANSIIKIN